MLQITEHNISLNLGLHKYARAFNYNWKRAWGHHNGSLPITAVRNTVEWSFSKLKLIKTFHRSAMFDKRLTNLAMTSIESETVKTVGMTELTKTFASLQTCKNSLSYDSNFIKHDSVQFWKQHSRLKAILWLIVLPQQCCEVYFLPFAVAKQLWDLTPNYDWNRPLPTLLAGSAPGLKGTKPPCAGPEYKKH